MDLTKFDESLENYLDSISPTETQSKKIDDALQNALAVMLSAFPDAEIYAQGSYSTDTMSKPLTANQNNGKAGEYDIDIAVEREVWGGASDSLDAIYEVLEENSVFSKMDLDNTKNSCVRINYADEATGVSFHVDLVPTRKVQDERTVANREEDSWMDSDAKAFADYFNGRADEYPRIRQVSVILKRLRDLAGQGDNVKSLLILTLVNDDYYDNGSVMGDLLAALTGIASKFSSIQPPYVANPVNQRENLMDRVDDYAEMRKFFTELCDELTSALTNSDYEKLSDIFGFGFSYSEASKAGFATAAAVAIATPTQAYGGDEHERDNL